MGLTVKVNPDVVSDVIEGTRPCAGTLFAASWWPGEPLCIMLAKENRAGLNIGCGKSCHCLPFPADRLPASAMLIPTLE